MKWQTPYTYRPILPDRIRLSVTPSYNDYKSKFSEDADSYWAEHRKQAHTMMAKAKLLKYKVTRVGKKPYISPHNYKGYIGNLMISPFQFVPVQMEFNFIRFLNCYLEFSPQESKYFDNVRIHENNYTIHDTAEVLVTYHRLIKNVEQQALMAADLAYYRLTNDNHLFYRKVCIKQIEFNTDIFIGHNQSVQVMQSIIEYLQSRKGLNWRQKKIKKVCSHVVQNRDKNDKLETAKYSNSISTKFELGKGVVLKIYTKTKDHIRVEILFNKKYITKYGSTDWNNVYVNLYEDATRIIKGIKFHLRIKEIMESHIDIKEEVKDMLIVTNACKDMLEQIHPGLSDLLDAQLYTGVVTSDEGKKCIRKYKQFREQFIQDRDNHGNIIYRYSPEEAHEAVENRKEAKRIYNHKDKNSPRMQKLLEDVGATFR